MVQGLGGIATARAVNRELVGSVDVLLGNEEDLAAALGYEVEGLGPNLTDLDPANFARIIDRVVEDYPNLRVVATTLRGVTLASRNDWGAILWADGTFHQTARVH
jgi:2-dehydro-3-deoxygluconokinase